MGRNNRKGKSKRSKSGLRFAVVALGLILGGVAVVWVGKQGAQRGDPSTATRANYVPRPRGELTFTRDVAPIVFQQCAPCHRPGQSAPFGLQSYDEVKKHATDIAEVTARRYMPPWLPEAGYGDFMGERRLSGDQLGMLQQWVAEGAKEGRPSDLPALPKWSGDWQLGPPDLVVTMPKSYTLAGTGRDVYRNFVIPVPIPARRYVKGIEVHPGNPKVVHHAFVKVDRSGKSRRLAEQEPEPGFPGMVAPAEMPEGHFLGWQPGRMAKLGPPGLPWRLDPGNDLVLQTHLNPSGKSEELQASIGLYFTDEAATNSCFKLALTSSAVDIPAGAKEYVVEDSYVLPVDLEVLGVLPHAHYLAREMEGWVTRPDGAREWLLRIKQWDFNWQGDYSYAKPISLPKGSRLSMRFTYDNSTNNTRNPNHPPQEVAYGSQSKDEMAELWFQVLPHNREDLARLGKDYEVKIGRTFLEGDEAMLRRDSNNAGANTDLGMLLMEQGRSREAEAHFQTATRAHPDFALAHYDYAVLLRREGRLTEAQAEFEEDLRLDPKDFKAHGNLGYLFMEEGNLEAAGAEFESALRLNPADELSRDGLQQVLGARKKR